VFCTFVLWLFLLRALSAKPGSSRCVWLGILLMACVEPVLQMVAGFPGKPFPGLDVFVGLHVFAIGVAGLASLGATIARRK